MSDTTRIKEIEAEMARLTGERKALQAVIDKEQQDRWLARQMKVTLTAEQWAEEIAYREAEPDGDWTKHRTFGGGYTIADVAALLLYGHPFGFTRKDVRVLRINASMFNGDPTGIFASLADRIEALLPPESQPE